MSRVIVVGAGMGGLACAARLAVKGHDVLIVEQAATWGGKLGVYSRDGFTFDTGPSLLTLPAVYRDTFLKTGAALEDCVEMVGVDPVCHYRFADGTELDIPDVDRRAVARAFDGAFGGTAGNDWLRFLEHAGRIWQATRGPFLSSTLEGPMDLVRQSRRLRDLLTIAPWRTLDGMGRRYLKDPRMRQFLWRYATYAGSDPRKTPAALAVIPYVEQTFGAWHIQGGLRKLGEALYDRCVERGVAFRFQTDVAEITVTEGRATGVRLSDGEWLAADIVVSNADATEVYGHLVPDRLADAGRTRLRKASPSLAGFVLLLAVEGRTPGLRHHNVLFPEHYQQEFDSIFGSDPRPVQDPTVYIAAPPDDAMRPEGSEAWFVLVNAPRHDPAGGGIDWATPGLAESYADRVLAVMAERGFEVRDRLRWRVVRTPADLEHSTRAPGGAIYGTSSNGARSAFLRAANRSPVPGLYLVGGSAHPGGGLPLVGLSAELVADLIGRA